MMLCARLQTVAFLTHCQPRQAPPSRDQAAPRRERLAWPIVSPVPTPSLLLLSDAIWTGASVHLSALPQREADQACNLGRSPDLPAAAIFSCSDLNRHCGFLLLCGQI